MYGLLDVYFSFLHILIADGISYPSFHWDNPQDHMKEMKYGYFMRNLKGEVPLYCYETYVFILICNPKNYLTFLIRSMKLSAS